MIPPTMTKLTTDSDRSIGTRIAAFRTAQGHSQTALGQALGVSFQQVQKYEKGRNRVGAVRLQTIADFLGVSISTFFEDQAESVEGKEPSQHLLQDPQVMELVRVFTSIPDKAARSSVLSIVKAAASLQRGAVATVD